MAAMIGDSDKEMPNFVAIGIKLIIVKIPVE